MTDDNQFSRIFLTTEECAGKLHLSEVRCAGYYSDDGKEHITAAIGRSMTLPATAARKKRPRKQAA